MRKRTVRWVAPLDLSDRMPNGDCIYDRLVCERTQINDVFSVRWYYLTQTRKTKYNHLGDRKLRSVEIRGGELTRALTHHFCATSKVVKKIKMSAV